MIYLNQVHEKREETAKNILSIYSNKDSLVTKELSVEDFQKSYPIEEFSIITNDIRKSYSQKVVEDINSTEDKAEREALVKSASEEMNSYTSINVKSENGDIKRFYVKKKEDEIEKGGIEKVEENKIKNPYKVGDKIKVEKHAGLYEDAEVTGVKGDMVAYSGKSTSGNIHHNKVQK